MYGGILKATSESTAPGTTVTLTASGLSEYTNYSVKVRATETNTAQKLWNERSYGTIKTYCSGYGGPCDGTFGETTCSGTIILKGCNYHWKYLNAAGNETECDICDQDATNHQLGKCPTCGKYCALTFFVKCKNSEHNTKTKEVPCAEKINKCGECGSTSGTHKSKPCQHGIRGLHS